MAPKRQKRSIHHLHIAMIQNLSYTKLEGSYLYHEKEWQP